jgi:hypothetical protein
MRLRELQVRCDPSTRYPWQAWLAQALTGLKQHMGSRPRAHQVGDGGFSIGFQTPGKQRRVSPGAQSRITLSGVNGLEP